MGNKEHKEDIARIEFLENNERQENFFINHYRNCIFFKCCLALF